VATLVTLQEAKEHLKITTPDGDPADADLQAKVDEAEAVIIDYMQAGPVDDFVGDWIVRAAILIQVGQLDRFRGDDDRDRLPPRPADGYLLPEITSLLQRKKRFAVG
jgi:hypothetical protein